MKYVLITGASTGIGAAIAEILATQGKHLLLIARSRDKLIKLQKKLSQYDIDVQIETVDVMSQTAVDAFFDSLEGKSLEAVINNAGLARGRSPFQDGKIADFFTMIDTNIKGFVQVAHRSMPFLLKSQGTLVNVSSIAGRESYAGGHVYCGTKAFVKSFSKALRFDVLGTGMRVVDIAPGAVETNFSIARYGGDKEKAKQVYEKFQPLVAEDIAQNIAWALNQPDHVNIESMVIYPTDQASPGKEKRSSRPTGKGRKEV